ncbi:NUDIX domain-containing protein [Elizabethkingia argentiflava]|uniref:NUDIX domain-containing protein n=1 Tax=Elizabethkingia argenteiflava TaxID=2681556 RepID=A0A845PVY8_9FLAO|nr:NUDIX domain-containing protein [Elizabethkingia argenteiflava]NAW51994.1 NUDIX domain-containing protein [Elizabethkingia argenteiflava]
MLDLRFCPCCAQEYLSFNGQKMYCSACKFIFYNNTAAAVAVIIKHENDILLTRRNQNPEMGKLDLAGGFIDFEETAEQACKRELFEELQVQIDEGRLKYICSIPNTYPFKGIVYHTMDLFFEYEVRDKFDIILEEEEIAEALWINKYHIKLEELAFSSQRQFFEKYLTA